MAGSSRVAAILNWFDRLFAVKPREFARVHAFLLFLTTTSMFYTIGATVGDTLFLSRFGSREAERLLPWVYVGTGLVTVALTWLYERVEARFARERFVVGVNLALAASLLAFRWAIRSDQLWLYFALVIWLEACALLALMLFFSFAGDFFTSRDARRLYGYINGGIALGSIAGGYLVDVLVRSIGDDNLLYVCAALLALGALWCVVIPALASPIEEGEIAEEEDAGVPLGAVFGNRFLQMVIVLVLVSQACCWLVDFQLKIAASRALQEEALAVFFGKFYGYLGVVQFVVQFGLIGWLLRRFGVVKSLAILPALLCVSSAAFFFHPVFMVAAVGNFIRLTFLETLDEPAQELLFLPLSARLRVRAQSFVEGMVLPLGICLAGALLLALSGVLGDVRRISLVVAALGAGWIATIVLLVPRYRETLTASLRRLGLDSPDLTSTLASAEGVKVVEDLLRAADPDQQTLGLDLWGNRPLGGLTAPVRLLVGSSSEPVAVRALEALAEDKNRGHLTTIGRAQADKRASVRAAAISAHFEIDAPSALSNLDGWLEDLEPAVQVSVLRGCLAHGDRGDYASALARIDELLGSARVGDRVVAAQVLAQAAGRATTRAVERLLGDPAIEVRREVVAACARSPGVETVPWLVRQLREPSLRPAAAEALEGMPLSAVPPFIELIADRELPLEDRCLLTRILGRFGGLRAVKVLWELLSSEEDVMMRVAAADTLLFMKTRNPTHDLSRFQDDSFLDNRLNELAIIDAARKEAGGQDPFFGRVLFDLARLEIKTALFAMALSHDGHEIRRVEASLFEGSQAQTANALEAIDVIFGDKKAAWIAGLIGSLQEDAPSGGDGLRPGTVSMLMGAQPWLRAATRYHLAEQGRSIEGGEKMSGQELHMYRMMSRISFLKKIGLFQDVSASYLMSLAKIMQERTFVDGERLFSEGGKADAFYLVCEGEGNLTVGGQKVGRLGPRDSVGELALIEGLPYSASAVAVGELRTLRISAEEFNNVLLTHSEITLALLRRTSARLREALARSVADVQ